MNSTSLKSWKIRREVYLNVFDSFATGAAEIANECEISIATARKVLNELEAKSLVCGDLVEAKMNGKQVGLSDLPSGKRGTGKQRAPGFAQFGATVWQCAETYDNITRSEAMRRFYAVFMNLIPGDIYEVLQRMDAQDAEEQRKRDEQRALDAYNASGATVINGVVTPQPEAHAEHVTLSDEEVAEEAATVQRIDCATCHKRDAAAGHVECDICLGEQAEQEKDHARQVLGLGEHDWRRKSTPEQRANASDYLQHLADRISQAHVEALKLVAGFSYGGLHPETVATELSNVEALLKRAMNVTLPDARKSLEKLF